ncbi:MAG TPA: FAD-binding oxidoreductase [Ornithinimicrobium sp.]|uniref:FAD-binding oxidoreductase n=1 Tax=Ornithinimicrobium sp. TaxID=1977084 RepID=UPI002B4A4AD9|nr:FAD-binding oxidoreductase [Ornithinimicrobium sp.]HKJ11981.1 FAD-binding oxidoreductase [Ornithinimicrobium sp.]
MTSIDESIHDSDQAAALDALRRRVSGVLVTREEAEWDLARMPWLVNIPQDPLAVLTVRDVDDIVAAVGWAGEHGVQVTAQPTGHGANDALEGALILRTGALGGIEVDTERATAWVGAGVRAGELCTALDGTGLTYLCGSNSDPTVVGMTITGGISWLGRAYGIGSDSILAAELVDAGGVLRQVSATEDPELFWALRGGGGDFGIITRLQLALHPAPHLYGGQMMWPAEHMHDVLTAFRDVTRTAPEELSLWFHLWNFPPIPEVPEPLRGRSFTGVVLTFLGSPEDAEAHLAPLRAVAGLAIDTVGIVGPGQLADLAAEPTEPMPAMQCSRLMDGLDDATIAALTEVAGPGSGSPLLIVQIRHLGGAFARPVPDGGAHGPVAEEYSLFALGVPAVPELVQVILATFARVEGAVGDATSGRTLLNFLEVGEDPSRWWDEPTRDRLAAAKRTYDPHGTIRSNRPVLV